MPPVEEQTPAIVEKPADVESIVIHMQPSVRMTDDQFFEFCQLNRDLRIERTAEGEIVIVPGTGWKTVYRNHQIGKQLGSWEDRDGTGFGSDSSTSFRLPNGATRSPDAAWFPKARLAGISEADQEKFLPFCPDFVMELVSPSDTLPEQQRKMAEYMNNGARLGWVIDPYRRRVHVYRPGESVQELENPESVSGDPVLPGFVLDLTKVW